MNGNILFVDDDLNILRAHQRTFRARYRLQCAAGPRDALALLDQGATFAVIISDMHMPGMDGVQFLAEVRRRSPDTVRIMLTGNATLETSIHAVNQGHIFRFLIKPCPAETFGAALEAGLAQHRLITAEKELLTETLGGAVKLTTEVLALTNPTAFGRGARVGRTMQRLIAVLKPPQPWQCELAAMRSQIGCVAVPEETLGKVFAGVALSAQERQSFAAHPAVGRDLIVNIPRLRPIAEMIAAQEARYDGANLPESAPRGDAIPLGARMLKAASDFDTLLTVQGDATRALAEMYGRPGCYDPAVLTALKTTLEIEVSQVVKAVPLSELPANAILAEDVCTFCGRLLISRGQEVTPAIRARLQLHAKTVGLREPLKILVQLSAARAATLPATAVEPHVAAVV